ncbi:alpha/beta fold hydrolase [Patescibacteria group bacterium]
MKKQTSKIQVKKIKIDQETIEYAVRTGGPRNIFFLHGLNTSWRFWVKVLPSIPHQYTCYALSLPKYGQHRINHYLETVEKFIKQKEAGKILLVGHSLGGIIALQLASKGLDFERITLVNVPMFSQAPDLTSRTLKYWKNKLETDPIIKKTFLIIPARIKRFKKFFLRAPLESYLEGFSDVLEQSIVTDLDKVKKKIPIMVVDGRLDFLLWLCQGKSLYKRLRPEAIIKLFDYHFIPQTRPKKLAKIIDQFFSSAGS